MKVLVTGGAGYIGSHVLLALRQAGIPAVALDDLSSGFREAVPAGVPLTVGDVGDGALVARVLREHGVDAVMHFAGSVVVSESVEKPLLYYRNNTVNSLTLIEACARHGVGRFIFSSTAAVYGTPERLPVDEAAGLRPLSPYGCSKLMTERILRDAAAVHGMGFVILRYFNVAGADPTGRAGQRIRNATHLIKLACETALGVRQALGIFGTDYPTPDGTGVRDYIHVSDLAEAHLLALRHLAGGGENETFNCGYGHGASVRQVIAAVERATGVKLPVTVEARRPGDMAELVADADRIRRVLGWRPKYDDLDIIVRSALDWERLLRR